MFWTCCGRRSGTSPDWTESQKAAASKAQVNHRAAAQTMNAPQDVETSQNEYNTSNSGRIRTASSSSLGSVRSIQSFYSAKSGDEDFYSICSDNSAKGPSAVA